MNKISPEARQCWLYHACTYHNWASSYLECNVLIDSCTVCQVASDKCHIILKGTNYLEFSLQKSKLLHQPTQILQSPSQLIDGTYVILSCSFNAPNHHSVNSLKSNAELHHFEVSSNSNQQCLRYLIYSPNNQMLLQSSHSLSHISIRLFSAAGEFAHKGCSGDSANQADIKSDPDQKKLFK